MRSIVEPVSGPQICRFCGTAIKFDDRIKAKSGNPAALELDGSKHVCFSIPTSEEGWISAAIRLLGEINNKLTTAKLRIVREDRV